MRESLEADGVSFKMGISGLSFSHVAKVEGASFPVITASYTTKGSSGEEEERSHHNIECDALLIATGRKHTYSINVNSNSSTLTECASTTTLTE